MRLSAVKPGDLVLLDIKGRLMYGEVTGLDGSMVLFAPICPRTGSGWRSAGAHQVIGHWRKTGRTQTTQPADAQLRLT